ncbi:hypothetical protein N7456_012112 [Penicillium angulare]|uniref:Uncharacterized protein n=1 Tax=Penicillium angulare TaxID=116970 RepID=A0A9W9EV94_9EURO|nr:hypothetical protein N7456_012112 [Penicillium angulare]
MEKITHAIVGGETKQREGFPPQNWAQYFQARAADKPQVGRHQASPYGGGLSTSDLSVRLLLA